MRLYKRKPFLFLENVSKMPTLRLIGNAFLSLLTKISSGYWDLFDPTNGYTAISKKVLIHLPLGKKVRDFFLKLICCFDLIQ